MSERTENIKTLIDALTPAELQSLSAYLRSKLPKHALEQKWGIDYEVILDAIHRSQDIVQRGVRGVIAEAVFEARVLSSLAGWHAVPVIGDLPFDFDIRRDSNDKQVKIQVKLQRTQGGKPLSRSFFGPDTFIVEVQKTRTGTKRKAAQAVSADSAPTAPAKTRPYQFGDFDVIAVNMQPSTQDWTRFMYTVGSWLIPKSGDATLIETMQPVTGNRTDVWTDNLEECVERFLSGQHKIVFDVHAAKDALRKKRAAKKANRQPKAKTRGEIAP